MIKGLEDITPTTVKLAVGKGSVVVRGVSLRGIASLVSRYAELAALLDGRALDAQSVLRVAPDAAAAIMAAACGYAGDPEAEKLFDSLAIEYQLNILEKAIELTMPGGFGPFVARLQSIASSVSMNVANDAGGQLAMELQPSSSA